MKRGVGAAAAVLLLFSTAASRAATDQQGFQQIERGHYLAIAGDCTACHTAPGGKPFAGGRSIATPFGTLLAPNITPDRETGIGTWTDDQFVAALQRGRGRGGFHLYPAMPYPYYTKTGRTDILAIRAYLATLEPVHHRVHANQLPFPFNIRPVMAVWNFLFFKPDGWHPVAGKSAAWNRGAYLVEGLGHCGACHTAKNFLGADKTSDALQGGLLQGWFAPDITGDAQTGLAQWSVEDIVAYLKKGHNRFSAATGPMTEVIEDSTSQMNDGDLGAIATYLKGDTPHHEAAPQPVAASDPAMRQGAVIYADNCSACHAPGGTGIAAFFPVLKGSASVQAQDPTDLIRVVLHGTRSVATTGAPTAPAMPAFGWKLSDAQAAAVVTYIRNSWGNAAPAVSDGAVKSLRHPSPGE